ncbi:hypothetical protein S83_065260 [Arachis hypogaea]
MAALWRNGVAGFDLAAICRPLRRAYHGGAKGAAIAVAPWRSAMKMAKMAGSAASVKKRVFLSERPKRLFLSVLFLSSLCLPSSPILATACRHPSPTPIAVRRRPSPLVVTAAHHHSSLFFLLTLPCQLLDQPVILMPLPLPWPCCWNCCSSCSCCPCHLGWKYVSAVEERNTNDTICNFCGKIMRGGITRAKEHLMIKPGNVVGCKMVSKDVIAELWEFYNQKKIEEDTVLRRQALRNIVSMLGSLI